MIARKILPLGLWRCCIPLAILLAASGVGAQPTKCDDWQYGLCFKDICAANVDVLRMSSCVGFVHGVLSGSQEEAHRRGASTGYCVPQGVSSRFIAERVAQRIESEIAAGRIAETFLTAPVMLQFLREVYPSPCR